MAKANGIKKWKETQMSEKERKAKISTFSKTMTFEEAEREKQKATPIGKSLLRAEEEYEKQRKK